jgi:hypothetical protein
MPGPPTLLCLPREVNAHLFWPVLTVLGAIGVLRLCQALALMACHRLSEADGWTGNRRTPGGDQLAITSPPQASAASHEPVDDRAIPRPREATCSNGLVAVLSPLPPIGKGRYVPVIQADARLFGIASRSLRTCLRRGVWPAALSAKAAHSRWPGTGWGLAAAFCQRVRAIYMAASGRARLGSSRWPAGAYDGPRPALTAGRAPCAGIGCERSIPL